MLKLHGVATILLASGALAAPIPASRGHPLLIDKAIPVGTAQSAFTLQVPARAPGHRLISVGQSEADVELRVTDAHGRLWIFDAPGRRAGAERACVFDDGKGLGIEIRFPGRKVSNGKTVRLQVLGLAGHGSIARGSELEVECKEALAAATSDIGARRSPTELAADYENAARRWEGRGNSSRAAFAYLQSGWMLARKTSDHVAALARGEQARRAFQKAKDPTGEALAILQITVPRVELLNAGLDATGRRTADSTALSHALRADLERCIAALDAAGESYFGAQARIQLAASHQLKGELDDAIRLLGEAGDRYRKAGESDGETRALANRSFMIFQRGRYREAAEAFDAVLALRTTRDFPEVKADILDNSAMTHSAVGNYDKALSQLVEALALHEEVKDATGMARSLNGLASTYLSLGVPRATLEYSRRARSVLESRDSQGRLASEPARLSSLLLTGEAHRELGDLVAAETAHREVLSLAATDLARVRARLELARVAIDRGDGHGALTILDAVPILKPGMSTYARQISLRRAQAALISSKPDMAAELLTPLRGQFSRLGASHLELEVLEALGRAHLQRARSQDALAVSDLGVAQLKALRLVSGDPETRARLNDVYRSTYALRVEILRAIRAQEKDGPTRQRLEVQIFVAADEARAGLARAASARANLPSAERNAIAAEIALRQKLLTALDSTGESSVRATVLRTELAELRARFDAAAPSQDHPLPVFKETDYSVRGLREDTVVLLYLRSADQLQRYVLTRSGVQELDARPIDQITRQSDSVFRLLSVAPSAIRGRDPMPALRALSLSLMPPAKLLEGRSQLIVVADNVVSRIPFGSLTVNSKTYSPLIAEHDVTMAVTLRDALVIGGMPARGQRIDLSHLVLFSDPVFSSLDPRMGGRAGTSDVLLLPRLSATVAEAKAIQASIPEAGVTLFSGFEATRDNLLEQAGKATVLHLATHAVATDHWPNGSGLMLSAYKPDGAPLNGYVSTLDLLSRGSAAHLVVLSACDTARGESGSGESVAGLARAVLGGGARRVVAAQWPVDDAITARIMRRFYAEIAADSSVARALAAAQREVLADSRLSDPARWAAFVAYERPPGD